MTGPKRGGGGADQGVTVTGSGVASQAQKDTALRPSTTGTSP